MPVGVHDAARFKRLIKIVHLFNADATTGSACDKRFSARHDGLCRVAFAPTFIVGGPQVNIDRAMPEDGEAFFFDMYRKA